MTEKRIRERVSERFGLVDFDLISYSKSCNPVEIKCNHCEKNFSFRYLTQLFSKDREFFCPYCKITKGSDRLMPIEEAQKRLDDNLNEKYTILSNSYHGWSNRALIRHSCGRIFKYRPRDLLICGHCPCLKIASKGRSKIRKILKKYSISFEENKKINQSFCFPFDFYLPSYNLLIEFEDKQRSDILERTCAAAQNGYDVCFISQEEKSSIEEILVQRLSLLGVALSKAKE